MNQNIAYPDDPDFDGTGIFTVMAWIKLNSGNFTSSTVVAGKHNGANGWKLAGSVADKLNFYCNSTVITGNKDVGDRIWHHVAASFSTDTVKMFVDGTLDKVSAGTYAVTANASALILGSGYNGVLDDVRYYSGYLSENTIKTIFQQGFNSTEGIYDLRADNNSTIHIKIDGANVNRYFPVFKLRNYWAATKPLPECVVLNGKKLEEGNDYYADLDNTGRVLSIGLNKILSEDEMQLYIDDKYSSGYQMTGETKKMSWGVENNGSYDYLWVKNFSENCFGDANSNQWYINWKMSNAGNSKDGEIWHMASSLTNPNTVVDTISTINLIPGYDNEFDSWGSVSLGINSHFPKTSYNVANTFTYAVEESRQ